MKKFLAILLAVAMVMSFSLVAAADETTEGYTAYLKFCDTSYTVALTEGVTTTVNSSGISSGTYTLSWDLPEGVAPVGISMLYVEIYDSYDVLSNWTLSDVQISIDGQAVEVNTNGIYTYAALAYDANYNLVATNNYTIELRNDVAGYSQATGVGAVDPAINITSNITVTFTLTDPNADEQPAIDGEEEEIQYKEVEVEVTTTLEDIECAVWWAAHTAGVELTETPTTITYTNTTLEAAVDNWNTASWILYTGNEAKVNGDGYDEYWVHRSDNYGWAGAWGNWVNTNDMTAVNALGVTREGTYEEGCWDTFLADSKAGHTGTVVGYLDGNGNAVVTISYHGVTNTLTIPVDTTKPVYLSLTGDMCNLSNITATTTEINLVPVTADNTNLIALGAAMILTAAGVVALVVNKKEF